MTNDSYRFSRRSLIKSLGLGAAFVPVLGTQPGWAAGKAPRRLVVLQWTNGCIGSAFWPSGGETAFNLPECLSPFEPHRQELLIPSAFGLRCQTDSKVAGAGVGHQSLWALLTGKQAAAGRNDAGPCGIANGISVDQYVANVVAESAPHLKFKSLELGAISRSGKDNERAISYRGPAVGGRPADNPPEINPTNLWTRLFSEGTPGAGTPGNGMPGMDADFLARLRAERKSVLDFVGRELNLLKQKVGSAEAPKIEQHEAALRQLEIELGNGGAAPGGVAPVSCTAPAKPGATGKAIDKIAPLQLDLLVTALKCDLTRVATVMFCSSANDGVFYPFLGLPSSGGYLVGDHHAFAHSAGNNAGSGDGKKKVAIDKWWMQQFANFVAKLKATPDVEGNMLDNTLILIANHMDNGASHGTSGGVPMFLVGSCQRHFKTGRWVTGHGAQTPHNQLLTAVANAMTAGIKDPLKSFGDAQYGGELVKLRG